MNLPSELLASFEEAEVSLRRQTWFDEDWACCSGYWEDVRYSDTIVLKLSRKGWTSRFPITLYEGAEIHYAAWVDEKTFPRQEIVFGMHVFGFPMSRKRRIRKGDFADRFRERNGDTILNWGHHDISRGPRVPYGGKWKWEDGNEIPDFLVEDFSRFSSLANSIDAILTEL